MITLTISFSSCKKILDTEPPKSRLVNETVFQTNDQAIAALTGIYSTMASSTNYASGSAMSIACYAGLSSDELIGYRPELAPFYENQLSAEEPSVSSVYRGLYKTIYTANAVLEGLSLTTGVAPPLKSQLEGEALFLRAFSNFYLVNLFGDVPLQLTTDYRVTEIAPRSTISSVYQQIVKDLKVAEEKLLETYPTNNRVRPNKSAAQAMLARSYLYLHDWHNAEKYASNIINKTGLYKLVSLDAVFLANTQEAIWQLMPSVTKGNTEEGSLFIPANLTIAPLQVSLTSSFVTSAFDTNDKRKDAWVKHFTVGSNTYYYPFKYKNRNTSPITEYSIVLRLAEQYLIRAEARIHQDKISEGIADLNLIRQRPLANIGISNPILPISSSLNKSDALRAVERERKVELFSEWGHRWLDVNRTGRADIIFSNKPSWRSTDILYPIPLDETSRNPNIKQNDGY